MNTTDPDETDLKYIDICAAADISEGSGKSFKVGSLFLAVYKTQNQWFATSDICSHEHEHLSQGWLEGFCVECPRHGAAFDLRTGEAMTFPATEPIETFPLKLSGDRVMVGIPEHYLD